MLCVRDRCQRSLEERLDDRRFPPRFVHEAQAGFLDQRALPVTLGDFVERLQAETVRQAQLIEPA